MLQSFSTNNRKALSKWEVSTNSRASMRYVTLTNRESLLKRKEKSSGLTEVASAEFDNEDSTDMLARDKSCLVQEAQIPATDTNPRTTPQDCVCFYANRKFCCKSQ